MGKDEIEALARRVADTPAYTAREMRASLYRVDRDVSTASRDVKVILVDEHSRDVIVRALHAYHRPASEAEIVCGELYQVLASIAGEFGLLDHPDIQRALDNASAGERLHKDLLEWPKTPLRMSAVKPPSDERSVEGQALATAWEKYIALFGEQPHGTLHQMNALAALLPPSDDRAKVAEALRHLKEIKTAPSRFRLGEYAVTNQIARAIRALSPSTESDGNASSFQSRVDPWLMECFGADIARSSTKRNHCFLEEALELVQANGCTAAEAHQIVEYVYGRDQGDINQEVGGVMVTLAALCLQRGVDMHAAGEKELARIWTKIDKILAKNAAKPEFYPGPSGYADRETLQTILELLNRMHGRQTRNKDLRDAPPDRDYSVNVTGQMESDLSQAVCILENRLALSNDGKDGQ